MLSLLILFDITPLHWIIQGGKFRVIISSCFLRFLCKIKGINTVQLLNCIWYYMERRQASTSKRPLIQVIIIITYSLNQLWCSVWTKTVAGFICWTTQEILLLKQQRRSRVIYDCYCYLQFQILMFYNTILHHDVFLINHELINIPTFWNSYKY